jgi:hypothetical protein
MTTVAGVFRSRESAEHAADELRRMGVRNVNLVAPGTVDGANAVPTTPTEQPGMGRAVGGVVGAGIGIAGGFEIGTALASMMLPGVGPVVASGIAIATLFGVGGALGGAAAGEALEQETTGGLPEDEIYVYKDALRQGRAIVFVQARDADEAVRARGILEAAEAESIDAAREQWWIGLRPAEMEHYEGNGGNWSKDEKAYRRGYEAGVGGKAMNAKESNAFRRGYERGKSHAT